MLGLMPFELATIQVHHQMEISMLSGALNPSILVGLEGNRSVK